MNRHMELFEWIQKALDAIQKSFTSFLKKYDSGVVNDDGSKQTFQELQKTLIDMFPKSSDSSACPVIQQARDQYNQMVDSIQQMNVAIVPSTSDVLAAVGGDEGRAINAKLILSNARQLDNTVALWLVSKDEMEREDLVIQGRNIIKDTSAMIGNSRGQTPEEQNAVSLFRKAEQYFNKVCK